MSPGKCFGRIAIGSGIALISGTYVYQRNEEETPGWLANIKASLLPIAHAVELLRRSQSYAPPPPSPMRWDPDWDKREPESLVKPGTDTVDSINEVKSKATRNIFLIRHGQYQLDGKTDAERYLTELGREQAAITGARLQALGVKYDQLVYSTMTRATETANIMREQLDKDLPAKADSLLEEGSPFRPEPSSSNWRPDAREFLVDGTRIEAAFRKYIHRAKPTQEKTSFEIYVCHANVIRYFVCRALQYPPEGWLRISLANGSITWLVVRPNGNVSIKSLGDSGHMPPNKVTYT